MDRLSTLQRRERMIAVVRWVGVVFMALQLTLYEVPAAEFAEAAARVRPVGYLVAGALALVNIAAEILARTARGEDQLVRWGAVFLAADVVAVFVVIFLWSFDPITATWAIMTVLPLEGALRFRLRGALGVWAAVGVLYTLREFYAEAAFGIAFEVPSVVYRVGLVLVIALFAGFMARDLELQLDLLHRLNVASQQLASRLDPDAIARTLCEQARACLDARTAVVATLDGGGFKPVASWPPAELDTLGIQGAPGSDAPDLGQQVLSGPVWLEGAGDDGRLVVPLRWQADPVRDILVIHPRAGRPGVFEREVAASLAESAALAMATARVLDAEQRTTGRLRYLEALRTRFVATIAHDLRLPLTVFKGVSRMLRSRRDALAPEQIDEMLESVERQSNRLSRLADDLLDAARLDADRLVLHLEPCDLRSVVLASTADAEGDVTVDVEPGLEVVADPGRLERVVWNLLSNAEKYGSPPVEVTARRNDGHAQLSVRDHGSGLDTEQQDRLFSDFGGSDDAASVGLGLAIVWQLVNAHGGEVSYADAEPGARFTVSLPLDGPPAASLPNGEGRVAADEVEPVE